MLSAPLVGLSPILEAEVKRKKKEQEEELRPFVRYHLDELKQMAIEEGTWKARARYPNSYDLVDFDMMEDAYNVRSRRMAMEKAQKEERLLDIGRKAEEDARTKEAEKQRLAMEAKKTRTEKEAIRVRRAAREERKAQEAMKAAEDEKKAREARKAAKEEKRAFKEDKKTAKEQKKAARKAKKETQAKEEAQAREEVRAKEDAENDDGVEVYVADKDAVMSLPASPTATPAAHPDNGTSSLLRHWWDLDHSFEFIDNSDGTVLINAIKDDVEGRD